MASGGRRRADYYAACRCGTDLYLTVENTCVRIGLTPRVSCPLCGDPVWLADQHATDDASSQTSDTP